MKMCNLEKEKLTIKTKFIKTQEDHIRHRER